jgi:hypothetical protein
MNVERKVGDIVVGTANADGKTYICILTEIDYTPPPPKLDNYDVGVCLRGQYLGHRIRLDRVRVVMTTAELLRLAEEDKGFDLSTPPETPDELLPEAERTKRENQRLLKRIEEQDRRLAALEQKSQ